jgi:hypothetical protein
MFHNRRTVFLFTCLIVFLQALYYIITFQINGNQNITIDYIPPILDEHSSDISVQNTTIFLSNNLSNTSIQKQSIQFADASISNSINFIQPDPTIYDSLQPCQYSNFKNDSSYLVTIDTKINPFSIIEKNHAEDLHVGGHWFPKTCRAEQRLAIILCYRTREIHLKLFLNNMHSFLKKQQLDYTIFVVNQHGNEQFNRAALFNVGFIEAMKLYSFNCFIFHDVDLIPEDLRNLYRCGDKPRHMSVAVDKFNYKLFYSTLFGGVTAFSLSDFLGANGYPTVYWGWGGEDDDMYLRVTKKLNTTITRYPIEIARYKMIRTYNHTSGKANPDRHTILGSKYNYNFDGINTTNYTLNRIVFYRLFTLINVTLIEESFEQICRRLNITKKKKVSPRKKMKYL